MQPSIESPVIPSQHAMCSMTKEEGCTTFETCLLLDVSIAQTYQMSISKILIDLFLTVEVE